MRILCVVNALCAPSRAQRRGGERAVGSASSSVVRGAALALLLLAAPARAWVITETPLTVANSGPNFIVVGPDGNMWFTEYNTDKIGVVDSRSGALLHEFATD